VFLQLARNIARFEGGASGFRSWAFIVAHHRLIDSRRKTRRYQQVFDSQPLPDRPDPIADVEADALSQLDVSWVTEALSELTDGQRDVIALRVLGGCRSMKPPAPSASAREPYE